MPDKHVESSEDDPKVMQSLAALSVTIPPASPGQSSSTTRENDVQPNGLIRVTLVDPTEYKSMKWQNGMGTTQEIMIHPTRANFRKDEFVWRLSSASIAGSCAFSVFPHHSNTIVLLPSPPCSGLKIFHNQEATANMVKPLMPYTYDSNRATTCELASPAKDLTLIVNKNLAKADVMVERIEPEETFTKLMLADTTVLFVVRGELSVAMEASQQAKVLENQTLILERDNSAAPKTLRIKVSKTDDASDAVFVLCQISEKKPVPGAPGIMTPSQSSSTISPRKNSLLMFEEQPLWALPTSANDVKAVKDQTASPATARNSVGSAASAPSEIRHTFHPSQTYEPPSHLRHAKAIMDESEVPPPQVYDRLILTDFPLGQISSSWINVTKQGLGEWIRIPCIIARGPNADTDGTVVGITAALHGNEVNGVSCIHRLINDLDVNMLKGTVVAVPCVNIPGYLNFKREFSDNKDLNRMFPGKPDGTASEVFAYSFMEKVVNCFNYLIDLHTASFGRVNSYYVRADMNDPITNKLAKLQSPQIILHNSGQDGTLRSAASKRGISAITVEIGNPQLFQNQYIEWSYQGLMNILKDLGLYQPKTEAIDNFENQVGLLSKFYTSFDSPDFGPAVAGRSSAQISPAASLTSPALGATQMTSVPIGTNLPQATVASMNEQRTSQRQPLPPTLCSKGFWLYTRTGGVLEVYPHVNSFVRKGMLIARIKNIFGNVVDEYFAPCDAMTIGRSSNPVAMAGDRIIHLGVPMRKGEQLPAIAKENY